MKSFAVLAVAAGVAAQSTPAYVSPYISIGQVIGSQVASLNALVAAYTGGADAGSAIVKQANTVYNSINSGASAAAKLSSFTDLGDALFLLDAYDTNTGVAASVQTVVSNLIKKESIAGENGLCSTARVLLSQDLQAASGLAAAIVSQLQDPAVGGATDIATNAVIAPITSALSQGIASYATCTGPTSSSSSSSSSSGSSSGSSSSSNPTSSSSSGTTTSSTPSSSSSSTTSSASTCTSTPASDKVIKKCLKILSSAALHQDSYEKREL